MSQRVVVDKLELKELVKLARKYSGLTWAELEDKLKINGSILRESYLEDNRTISYVLFMKLCKLAKLSLAESLNLVKSLREKNWNKSYAGHIGGLKKKSVTKVKITKPRKSINLAEFTGIFCGDGSIDKVNYTLQITLDRKSDLFYSKYVVALLENLFGVKPKIYYREGDGVIVIRLNSKELFVFLRKCGIITRRGKKRIPNWILERRTFVNSFIRGLVDTDGSMHLSSRWCVLNFTSNNSKFFSLFVMTLENFGVRSYKSGNKVNITSLWKIKKYMSKIGTSNLKNVIKFLEYTQNHQRVLTGEIKKYSRNYQSVTLPYFYKGVVV